MGTGLKKRCQDRGTVIEEKLQCVDADSMPDLVLEPADSPLKGLESGSRSRGGFTVSFNLRQGFLDFLFKLFATLEQGLKFALQDFRSCSGHGPYCFLLLTELWKESHEPGAGVAQVILDLAIPSILLRLPTFQFLDLYHQTGKQVLCLGFGGRPLRKLPDSCRLILLVLMVLNA